MKAKQIVIVGYDDVMGLDLVGPLEAFGSARVNTGPGKAEEAYRVTVAALGAKTFRSEFGLAFTTTEYLSEIQEADTLLVPGGRGMRRADNAQHWERARGRPAAVLPSATFKSQPSRAPAS